MTARGSKRPPLDAEAAFRALADATRQRLLQLLLREELNVTELVEVLGQPQSTVSRHLKVLRAARLICDRRNGAATCYSAVSTADDDDDLPALLRDWLKRQDLPEAFRHRLEGVLHKRQDAALGFFERLGTRWDELRNEAFGEAFAVEAFLALLPADWVVADLGAGTGFLLPALARRFRRVLAVEPVPAMLECARRRIAESGSRNIVLHPGALDALPIRDASCDLAVASLVLHHIPEPGAALAEMLRILRPSGRLLVVEQQAHDNEAFHTMMQDRWRGFAATELIRQAHEAGFRALQHHELTMTHSRNGSADVPRLFVVTGEKPGVRSGKSRKRPPP